MVSVPGGAIGKVVRWAFEQQGLYQPPSALPPVNTPGAPPDVDVYIEDGFAGQYTYLEDFWETANIWNFSHRTPARLRPITRHRSLDKPTMRMSTSATVVRSRRAMWW